MGIAFISLGRFDEAVAAAKKALHNRPITYGPALSLPRGSLGAFRARCRSEEDGGPIA